VLGVDVCPALGLCASVAMDLVALPVQILAGSFALMVAGFVGVVFAGSVVNALVASGGIRPFAWGSFTIRHSIIR